MLFIFINFQKISQLYKQNLKENLKNEAILVGGVIKDKDISKMHGEFSSIPSRFSLISSEGKIIYDSDEFYRTESLDNHFSRLEVQESLKKGEGFSIRESTTQKRVNAYYATVFSDVNNKKFILRVSQNYKQTSDIVYSILFFDIVFFVFLNLLIHFAYRNYLKEGFISKLNGIKNYLTKRTLSQNKEYSFKEDKWLIDFWRVAEEWQEENINNLRQLNREKNLLNSVISSVESSILLVDKDFNIVLKNNQLNYLFNSSGKTLLSSLKPLEIYDIINQFKKNYITKEIVESEVLNKELYLDEYKKFYLITIKIFEESSFLILIKDITTIREFIEVQKNFISNISHELKTPLTNIKGYLIALEDAPVEMKKTFFTTIYNNINKLENIIQDFLNISKLESSNILNIQEVSWNKIENDLKLSLVSIIEKREGEIIFEKSANLGETLVTDYDKVQLILKNLVENGFIYNRNKSPKVKISFAQDLENYIFTISDNGIGIEKSKIEKIFDRFYRIDEARTTNLSGTGLGLSIVKEIVDKFKGEITLDSEVEVGTTFVVKIPKN